ncbi:hypothetical protein C1I98_32270 [Spongiactinospora gelatinilytica]|uniref:Uncharacterized protein n=1 Tax=Spongiactinospora gelatinilytica TaxID=2666298 RepID=A0A2W2G533_9ACTN|nr:hypothetical protein [Spongiactinospora gelatinilytica]PZG29297.1 hypothetical protein C1I98_32270 [Spongiactinospora gelatinilytica]
MLAVVAAIVFGLGLLLDLVGVELGAGINATTFMLLGLLLLALHQAGVGTAGIRSSGGTWRGRARR